MGTFKWPLRIASMDGQQARDIEATVDTGASFTTLPASLLRELGIKATGKRGFLLADGRRVDMNYGQAWATIDGESVVTIVVFGEDEAPSAAGGIHPGGSRPGGGPGGSAAGPHKHDPLLGRCAPSSPASQPSASHWVCRSPSHPISPPPRRRPHRFQYGAVRPPAPPCRSGWRRGQGCAAPSGPPCDVQAYRTAWSAPGRLQAPVLRASAVCCFRSFRWYLSCCAVAAANRLGRRPPRYRSVTGRPRRRKGASAGDASAPAPPRRRCAVRPAGPLF